MGATLKRMVQSIDPITQACYFSGFEYYQILLDYVLTTIDVNKLVYNIFHNAGKIYDAATDLIDNFRFNDPGFRSYWQRIGNDIGLVVNQISYKPQDYDPYTKKTTLWVFILCWWSNRPDSAIILSLNT